MERRPLHRVLCMLAMACLCVVHPAMGEMPIEQRPVETQTAKVSAHSAAYQSQTHYVDAMLEEMDLYDASIGFEDIDFSVVPLVDSEEMLRSYLWQCRQRIVRVIPIRLGPSLAYADIEIAREQIDWRKTTALTMEGPDGTLDVLMTCDYLPGARIADAHLRTDTSALNDREMAAYETAMRFFAEEYPQDAGRVEQERAIFDYVQGSCEYWQDDTVTGYDTFRSALGVLLDGKANCMGYTDAFYMLATMAGFEVFQVMGTFAGNDHSWNLVQLDGQWYMIDATENDMQAQADVAKYVYFNAGQDLFSVYHRWDRDAVARPVARWTDGMHAFGNAAFPELLRVADTQGLSTEIALQAFGEEGLTLRALVSDEDTRTLLQQKDGWMVEMTRKQGLDFTQFAQISVGSTLFVEAELHWAAP